MENNRSSKYSRRAFVKNLSFASAFLLSGQVSYLSAAEVAGLRKKTILRFAVASDLHYGQPDTPFDKMTTDMVAHINHFHASTPLDFCVLNGDIIHDDRTFLPKVKVKTDALAIPYYVCRGNHDMVTPEEWETVWKTPLNYTDVAKETPVIIADTSNEKGEYLAPDLNWLEDKLAAFEKYPHVFVFLHIPQAKWTANAIDTPALFTLLRRYPNIRAVFHGHEHDQDGVKMDNKLPFLFDSHVGGSWGTDYKGFRVVELLNNGTLLTYMMDPVVKLNELQYRI